MSQAGDLRKTVSRWLDRLPARVTLRGGETIYKADLRAVVDVLVNHTRFKDGLVCENGMGSPLTVEDVARRVGRNRNLVGAILKGLDVLGLTTEVSRGGVQKSVVRLLNLHFGMDPVASQDGNGRRNPDVQREPAENSATVDPVATLDGAVASVRGAVATHDGKSEPYRRSEVQKEERDAVAASLVEGRSPPPPRAPQARPVAAATRRRIAAVEDGRPVRGESSLTSIGDVRLDDTERDSEDDVQRRRTKLNEDGVERLVMDDKTIVQVLRRTGAGLTTTRLNGVLQHLAQDRDAREMDYQEFKASLARLVESGAILAAPTRKGSPGTVYSAAKELGHVAAVAPKE